MIIALPTSQANLVLTALEHLNPTCPTSTPVEFVKQNTVLPLINPESGARIKLIFSTSPFEQRAIERANVVKVGNTPVNFAALNDLIIYKVIAGRARDFDDIRSIARKNLPALDIAYIKNGWHCFKKKVENRLPASSPICVTNLESILKKSNRLRGELITQFRFQPGQ